MPTGAKIRMKQPKLEYGWLFKVSNFIELMDYWEKVRSHRVQEGFSNLIRSRELANLVDIKGLIGEHMSHPDAFGIYCRALSTEGSCLDAVSKFAADLLSGMMKTINAYGPIYVNSKGGYFTLGTGMEEYETKELGAWVLPKETVSVKQWPGGKHWYASVGGSRVVRNGEE